MDPKSFKIDYQRCQNDMVDFQSVEAALILPTKEFVKFLNFFRNRKLFMKVNCSFEMP